jgi:hypothetical protein
VSTDKEFLMFRKKVVPSAAELRKPQRVDCPSLKLKTVLSFDESVSLGVISQKPLNVRNAAMRNPEEATYQDVKDLCIEAVGRIRQIILTVCVRRL